MPGTLYVVATPLGNLRDVTLRALDILGSVDTIAAEDTRVTRTLLAHYGIRARTLSLNEHNEAARAAHVVSTLGEGRSVAIVTDAGTPAVSDPGARVVRVVRDAGLPVVPIPGPSAAIAAISAAGLGAERFLFLGFLPSTPKARRALLASLARLPFALVVYEAPHRVRKTVVDLLETLGGERNVVIARELTKKFETISRVTLDALPAWLDADPNRERGELVLLVDAPAAGAPAERGPSIDADALLVALVGELPPARAARIAAACTGLPREVLYARVVALKNGAS